MVDRHQVFLTKPPPRAFAISDSGGWWMAWKGQSFDPTQPGDPASRALRGCEEASGSRCVLYAVDDAVVYRAP